MGEYFRQRAIKYFDAIYVVPIFQVLYILTSTIMGAIFFGEFKVLTHYQIMIFISGIFITVTGVAVLAFEIGAAYKTMIKKINRTVSESFSFSKNSPKKQDIDALHDSINIRYKFPAFYGASYSIANAMSSDLKIVIDDALFSPINKENNLQDIEEEDEVVTGVNTKLQKEYSQISDSKTTEELDSLKEEISHSNVTSNCSESTRA